MTREKAIKIVKEFINGTCLHLVDQEALETLIPELRESEDDRIIRTLQEYVKNRNWPLNGPTQDEVLAWLEKQKEQEGMVTVSKEAWDENAKDSFERGIKVGMIRQQKEQKPVPIKHLYLPDFMEKNATSLKQKEQKPALIAENGNWYICIKDFYAGGKKCASVGDLVQAKNGMYMMGRDDISEWFRRAYYEEVRDAFESNTDTNIPEKPVEWSEEDEDMRNNILRLLQCFEGTAECESNPSLSTSYPLYMREIDWLKSLRPHWKPSEEQMEALKRASTNEYLSAKQFDILVSLYEQLKKLKEE